MMPVYPQTPHAVVCDLPHGPDMSILVGVASPRHARRREPSAVFLRRHPDAAWQHIGNAATQSTLGELISFADSTEPYQGEDLLDLRSVLHVRLLSGSLYSAPALDVLLGQSLLMVGGELVAYMRAEQTGPNEWALSQLLRGVRDTGPACGQHVEGEPVMLIASAAMPIPYDPSQVGERWGIAVAAAGQSLSEVPVAWEAPLTGASGVPMRPVVRGGLPVARSRYRGRLQVDRSEMPDSEPAGRWEWGCRGGRALVRQIGAMGPGRWTDLGAQWVSAPSSTSDDPRQAGAPAAPA